MVAWRRAQSVYLVVFVLFSAACSSQDAARQDLAGAGDSGPRDDGSLLVPDNGPSPDSLVVAGEISCEEGVSCPPCVKGAGCAAAGPFIGETCCARGDALEKLAKGRGAEVVDLETDGKHVILCGGFGADINDISDPSAPRHVAGVEERCQRIGIGPLTDEGARVIYLAHHGDSWVTTPYLATYHLFSDGRAVRVAKIESRDVLFEGIAHHQGALYVAAHEGGVRVYRLDARGVPTFERVVVGGIVNAWKIAVSGSHAFVADAGAGLHVFSLEDPLAPQRVATVETLGSPRDVAAEGARVYVAMGGAGVDIFDVSDPRAPTKIKTLVGRGSAQAVDVDGDLLAVANWSHVALHDSASLARLATERTRDAFEQDLGVALVGSTLLVGEWEGLHALRYRPGYVGSAIWLDEEIFSLDPATPSRAVLVHNDGVLDLHVDGLSIADPAYSIEPASLKIAPGDRGVFSFRRPAPAPAGSTTLRLSSDDPDPARAALELEVLVEDAGSRLGIGDELTEAFGFLDPSGAGQLSALRGKVVVLAYFALF